MASGVVNGGFEVVEPRNGAGVLAQLPAGERPALVPEGWSLVGEAGNAATLDPARAHGGSTSLRLDAEKLPAGVASQSFLPPAGQEWQIQAWLRAEPAQTKLRLWVEGETEGGTISQVASLVASGEWGERRVRVANLPPGGLRRAAAIRAAQRRAGLDRRRGGERARRIRPSEAGATGADDGPSGAP